MFLSTKSCRKTNHSIHKTALIAILFAASFSLPSTASSGTPSFVTIPGSNISEADMETVEKKLLQRSFEHDPVDKRLQRLELMVFGATQYGTFESRWRSLKLNVMQPQKGKTAISTARRPAGGEASSSIAEIEKHVLKKTNPGLTTAQRLDQLESKVFGQANPAMPADQRIDRLRKTIGLADPMESPRTAVQPFEIVPGRGLSHGFGSGNEFFMHQFDPQTAQMLEDMDKQMRQFQNFGNMPMDGSEVHDFQSPDGSFHYHFEFRSPKNLRDRLAPNPSPSQPKADKAAPKIPGLKTLPPGYVPPYSDPNSI